MVKEGGNRPALKFINKTISRRKNYILILLVVQAFLGISGVFYALCIRSVIDEAVAGKKNEFCRYILYFICIVIFQIILRAVLRFMEEYARSTYENIFKLQLFKTILTKDFSQVTKFHSGEWMNRLTSDSTVVADGIATILPGTVGMTVKIFGALLMIIYIETKFVYIFIPGGLIFLILTYLFRKVLKKLHKQMQEKDGKLRIFLQEYLSSLMLVKTFLVEEKSLSKSIEKMEEHKNARMKKNHFSNLCNIGFAIMMQGTYVIGLAYCGYGILNNTISYGTLMAVMQLISQIQSPFANITGYLPKYYAMIASAERLMLAEEFNSDEFSAEGFNEGKFSIEDLKKKRAKKIKYNDEFNVILMKNISFFYDNNNKVLTDFSLEINKGEFVAITGMSGVGKSTIIKLLLGLYKQDKGEITPISRRLYAYVPQGNYLMSDSIREVVAFSEIDRSIDNERIECALRISCADFVFELPCGIYTELGEHGLGLSEGQMQRIAIARAIYSDRPVLILDEATSALDEVTEKRLLKNLRSLNKKTVIIITHRMAVLEQCDKHIKLG